MHLSNESAMCLLNMQVHLRLLRAMCQRITKGSFTLHIYTKYMAIHKEVILTKYRYYRIKVLKFYIRKISLHTLMIFIKNWMYLMEKTSSNFLWFSCFTNKRIIFCLIYSTYITGHNHHPQTQFTDAPTAPGVSLTQC